MPFQNTSTVTQVVIRGLAVENLLLLQPQVTLLSSVILEEFYWKYRTVTEQHFSLRNPPADTAMLEVPEGNFRVRGCHPIFECPGMSALMH